jgi:hypothetical protein
MTPNDWIDLSVAFLCFSGGVLVLAVAALALKGLFS